MNSANWRESPRLRRVLAALRRADGELTTREIMVEADVCAVNSCIAELRDNGFDIRCRQQVVGGRRLWLYRLAGQQEIDLA